MNEQRAVIQQMVDALDHADELLGRNDTLVMNGAAAGRWLLEQPAVQNPVAWMRTLFSPELGEFFDYKDGAFANETDSVGWTPLYTAPQPVPVKTYHDGKPWPVQPKPWVGLTDEEIHETEGYEETREMYRFALAIEAKLKEKNHDQ